MQLSKEEYARKRICNGRSVRIENSVTRNNSSWCRTVILPSWRNFQSAPHYHCFNWFASVEKRYFKNGFKYYKMVFYGNKNSQKIKDKLRQKVPLRILVFFSLFVWKPGAVARSEASSLGMQAAPSSIPTSGTFFRGDLVMKTFLRPFSLFHWFKKSSCQLLAKECALSTGKLPRRLAKGKVG